MFKELLTWSDQTYKNLPWRKKRTLYRTLVSEIMLQQTTVSTVLNHFETFIKKFPTIEALSLASEEEVCMAWKGLGYYRRARNLRKAAIDIQHNFKGQIPLDEKKLKEISGIGAYTANALLAIGANKNALAIDANLERVLSRLFAIDEHKGLKLQKRITDLFSKGELLYDLEKWGPRAVNEALMDLGRVYCQARKANCSFCPLKKDCQAFKLGKPTDFPRVDVSKGKGKFYELDLVRVVVKQRGKILAYKKSEKEWLSGQLELPTFVLRSEDKTLKQYPRLKKIKLDSNKLVKFKTSITKYKITNYILEMKGTAFKNISRSSKYHFVPCDPQKENFSTTTLKLLKKIE